MSIILTILIVIFGFIAFLLMALYLFAISVAILCWIVYPKERGIKEFKEAMSGLKSTFPFATKVYAILAILIAIELLC